MPGLKKRSKKEARDRGRPLSCFKSLKLSDLPNKDAAILRQGSSTRPTLWLIEENGVQAVVKDFSTNRWAYRNTVGRFLVWRERKAYIKLRDLKGVPALFRVIDGLALVLERIPGKNLENLEKERPLNGHFFDALFGLVEDFHRRGIAHCDLKRAPNVLVGPDAHPYVVDWGAAISKKEFFFFPLNRIYKRFVLDDLNAVIKLKLRHIPNSVTAEEKARYYHRSRAEKFIRDIRDKGRELLQKIS